MISDAEPLTLAVIQAMSGFTSEDRFLRYARKNLLGMFPLPGQSGYDKRFRKLTGTMSWLISQLAAQTSIAEDDVWLVDSTPVECARSRETVKRSDLAGWAEYGYCASPLPVLLGTTAAPGLHPARPPGRMGADRRGGRLRQIIETVNDTLKGHSTSNAMAGGPWPESAPASLNASSR